MQSSVPVDVILLGDCLYLLSEFPNDSVDAIVTDVPYGLGTKEPAIEDIVRYLQGEKLDTGGDFMGRDWEIPPVSVWKECYRVLKPGGHLLSFGGTRTFDLISLGIRAAGFQSRDTIASMFGGVLAWVHGQGFPKSLNISKAIDKMVGSAAEAVKKWEGWGTALKPSWEPVLVYRKPFDEASLAAQVLATGTGGLNIDATRVRHANAADLAKHAEMVERIKERGGSMANSWKNSSDLSGANAVKSEGRWPPNLILCHHPDCRQVGTRTADAPIINRFTDGMKPFGDGAGHPYESTGGGTEEIPVYDCAEGCPVRMLDEQGSEAGVHPAGAAREKVVTGDYDATSYDRSGARPMGRFGDAGGASRFFPSFPGQRPPDAPFFYTGKATGEEKNKGVEKLLPGLRLRDDLTEQELAEVQSLCDNVDPEKDLTYLRDNIPKEAHKFFEPCESGGNVHPTVKPLALMEWLVKLVTPPGGLVLDPYCGSGTTCVAAANLGMHFVGIDKDQVSQGIAAKRTGVAREERDEQAFQKGIFDELFRDD